MAVRTERGWWTALLLAGVLVLHLFMLTGIQGSPSPAPADHGMPPSAGQAEGAHGADAAAHTPAQMLSMCFAVLAVVGLAVRWLRAAGSIHAEQLSEGPTGHAGPRAFRQTSRDGPQASSRVDAGVLLRV